MVLYFHLYRTTLRKMRMEKEGFQIKPKVVVIEHTRCQHIKRDKNIYFL